MSGSNTAIRFKLSNYYKDFLLILEDIVEDSIHIVYLVFSVK